MEPRFKINQNVRIIRGSWYSPAIVKYIGEIANIFRYNTPITVTHRTKPDKIIGHLYSVCMDKDKSIQIAPEDWLEPSPYELTLLPSQLS